MTDEKEKKWSILLVDDEEDIRDVLSLSIADMGFAVYAAENGEQAIGIFRQIDPPIVMTDIKMPGMDGIELLQKLKRENPDTEVVMITGHGDMDLAIKSLKFEATDFITKPINVDARIIAATNQNLRTLIEEKRFREDLYYRLNVARFELPPLRERKEDIPPIVESFLEKYGKKMGRRASIGPGVMDYLLSYDFPGNIRELENMIEQGVALAQDGQVHLSDIVPNSNGNGGGMRHAHQSLAEIVRETEREAIVRVLRQVEGNKERAADLLGLSPTTLWRKMKRLRLEWP